MVLVLLAALVDLNYGGDCLLCLSAEFLSDLFLSLEEISLNSSLSLFQLMGLSTFFAFFEKGAASC